MNWTVTALTEFVQRLMSKPNPLKPAFHAYKTGTSTNLTGDGTGYTVAYNAVLYDHHGDFDTSTYTFTAPVTGKYLFTTVNYTTSGARDHTTWQLDFMTSNRNLLAYQIKDSSVIAMTEWCVNGSLVCDMDAGDTASVRLVVSGGTKDVNAIGDYGSGGNSCVFTGILLT